MHGVLLLPSLKKQRELIQGPIISQANLFLQNTFEEARDDCSLNNFKKERVNRLRTKEDTELVICVIIHSSYFFEIPRSDD